MRKEVTSELVHKVESHELIINVEDKGRSDLVHFLCKVIFFKLIEDLVGPSHVVLVDRIGEDPFTVMSTFTVVPSFPERVELLV